MNIQLNEFTIVDGAQSIYIDVETVPNYFITEIYLWKGEDYKNWDKAISLGAFLENINNKEKLMITSDSLGIDSFNGIWVVEAFTNYVSTDPCEGDCQVAKGVTYDLTKYYNCVIQYLLDSELISDCTNCPKGKNDNILEMVLLTFNSVKPLIDTCLYNEAALLLKKLEKLCNIKKCHNCDEIIVGCTSCKGSKQF